VEINDLVNTLNEVSKNEVYFGPQGFVVFSSENELKQGQVGFSIDEHDATLAGSSEGEWKIEWIVIASDTELGDPYFVDINDPSLAVYTAVQGESSWEIEKVAMSLDAFFQCLALLSDLSAQESPQFVPDHTSFTDSTQLQELKNQLIMISSCDEFWTMFMACYLDWLTEDEF
jgi:hypothetical protein